jgi:hypothetical protein
MSDFCLFEVDANASFCNAWPEIEIEINGQVLWREFVVEKQTISTEFELNKNNSIYIKYLNKRNGPEVWDTQIDDQGKIVRDQNCMLTNFKIGRSRCDFLKYELKYFCNDGTVMNNPWGFMHLQGHFHIQFPKEIYSWIVNCRKSYIVGARKQASSLDYWTNYLGDPNDPATVSLLADIDKLLEKLK